MRLVFKYTIDSYVGLSHFLISWCHMRKFLRKRKLLKMYGCGLDISNYNIGFKSLKYPSNLNLNHENCIYMECATPKGIIKRLTNMDIKKTLVVFHPSPSSLNILQKWSTNLSFMSRPEKNILNIIIGNETLTKNKNVIHVRCGDQSSFQFEGDEEQLQMTNQLLHELCSKIKQIYPEYHIITDSNNLAYIAAEYDINIGMKERNHSCYLKYSSQLIDDINAMLQSNHIISISNYNQPSCLAMLCSKLGNATYEVHKIKDFLTWEN